MNINEVILDKVRSLTTHDPATKELYFRLSSIEDPSLQTSAEGEELTDAQGSLITKLYRAKKGKISGTNSLLSMDLAAAQFGAKKEVATGESKITSPHYEIKTVGKDHTITLDHTPKTDSLKNIYSMAGGNIGEKYEVNGAEGPTGKQFKLQTNKVTLPSDVAEGTKFFIEYMYESENGIQIVNKATEFPKALDTIVYAYFRDKCDENKVYSGKIIAEKAKLNPEQVELALTSTGKHPFEFDIMNDYCDETDRNLFTIIITDDSVA